MSFFGDAGGALEKSLFPTQAVVPEWVTKATTEGLSPRSVRKYHVMLHSIFERAVRDQLILVNPCEHTELPKIILRRTRTLTPGEFEKAAIRSGFRPF